jgi:hypothetical protein
MKSYERSAAVLPLAGVEIEIANLTTFAAFSTTKARSPDFLHVAVRSFFSGATSLAAKHELFLLKHTPTWAVAWPRWNNDPRGF